MQFRRSAGPVVFFARDTGRVVAKCAMSGIFCGSLYGRTCTYHDTRREVPKDFVTPDWCEVLPGALEDAHEMHDFDRMGLTDMRRPELLAMAKEIPDEFRPKPLNRANVWMLRRAIRKAKMAEAQA